MKRRLRRGMKVTWSVNLSTVGGVTSTADLKAVRGVYWSDHCNIQCYIPNENVGSLVFKIS